MLFYLFHFFLMILFLTTFFFFFFNDTATTEIYTLSLHDALPICFRYFFLPLFQHVSIMLIYFSLVLDRKSTRLNSSHLVISYAVFCLKKKKKRQITLLSAKLVLTNNRHDCDELCVAVKTTRELPD